MRILHTADWHLGFRLGRHSRRPDTTLALKSLIQHAERTQPHVILHAGDVFHDERPPQSAIEDAVQALKALADHAPVIIAAGNHDGPRLLESLDRLAQEGDPQRITIATRPRTIVVNLTGRNDAPATVVIAAVPWLTRGDGAAAWSENGRAMNDPERPSHAKWAGNVIRETIEAAHADADSERATANDRPVPVIALIHSHLAGAVASNAEREIAVSREYAVNPNDIPSTAYCACGHIHDRQEIAGASADPDRQRPGSVYCGSLIQMTFGEKAQQKTVELVDIQPNTTSNSSPEAKTAWQVAESGQLGLDTERRLIEHNGSWDELAGMAKAGRLKDTILKATVNSEDRMHDLAAMVREIEPGIVIHEIRNPVTNPSRIEGQEIAFEDRPEPPIDELYEEWRRDRQTVEREADDSAVELFRTALKAVREPTEDPFGLKKLEERFEAIAARLQTKTASATASTDSSGRHDGPNPSGQAEHPRDRTSALDPPSAG